MTERYIVADHWSGGATSEISSCPVCASSVRSLHASAVFDHLDSGSPDLWTVWRCERCDSLYPDPRPSDASINAAYARYYTHQVEASLEAVGLRKFTAALVNGYMNRRFEASMVPASRVG